MIYLRNICICRLSNLLKLSHLKNYLHVIVRFFGAHLNSVFTRKIKVNNKLKASLISCASILTLFGMVNTGKNIAVSEAMANFLVFFSLIAAWILCGLQMWLMTISLRKPMVHAVLKNGILARLMVGKIFLLVTVITSSLVLSVNALVFLAVEDVFLIVLLANPFLFAYLEDILRPSVKRKVRRKFVPAVGAPIVIFINYFVLFIAFGVTSAVSLSGQEIPPFGVEAIVRAESFSHGSHYFEVVCRIAIVFQTLTHALIGLGEGFWVWVIFVVVLLTKSMIPFIAFTFVISLFHRWVSGWTEENENSDPPHYVGIAKEVPRTTVV